LIIRSFLALWLVSACVSAANIEVRNDIEVARPGGEPLLMDAHIGLREASASTYVKPGLPPFLLIHETKDEAVPYDQSVKFNAQLKSAGVKAELHTVENGIHGVINWEKNPEHHSYKPVMLNWLRKILKVC
jgi:dipeptidyl aminopeptidase/acylaminoacyl peptidase